MDANFKEIIWRQFGASIDMLENAIRHCPDDLWSNRSGQHEVWYLAYHTLFWLDLYLSGPIEGFTPPPPFTLVELDPAGLLPDRLYSKDELLAYLEHGRKKCRDTISGLTDESAEKRYRFGWGEVNMVQLLLYNMRHVQHHTAQMNLILRQSIDSAPRWVGVTKKPLGDR